MRVIASVDHFWVNKSIRNFEKTITLKSRTLPSLVMFVTKASVKF